MPVVVYTSDDQKTATLAHELYTRIIVFLDISTVQSLASLQRSTVSGFKLIKVLLELLLQPTLYTASPSCTVAAYHVVQMPAPTCHVIPCSLLYFPSFLSVSLHCQSVVQPAGQPASQPISHLSGSRLKLGLFPHLIPNRY